MALWTPPARAVFVLTGTITNTAGDLVLTGTGAAGAGGFINSQLTLGASQNLSKTLAGTWYLRNNANSITNAITLTGGLLSVDDTLALGGTSGLILNGGGFQFTGASATLSDSRSP